jgi:hypothetical protein
MFIKSYYKNLVVIVERLEVFDVDLSSEHWNRKV